MTTTELLFPIFKHDAETQASLKSKGPEIFSHFCGVPGLQSFFRGTVIADDGKPVDASSGRAALVLEWDDPSSLHAFYPDSSTFQAFIKLVRPFVATPDVPELFEAVSSSAPCASASVTQIIKVAQRPETEKIWSRLQDTLSETQNAATPVFSHASGIESQQGVFLGMVGWQSLRDYEESRANGAVIDLLRELGASGKVVDVVVQVERMAV
ncbi:hypothetical protein BDW59DRAFT_36319 [Aspergillus cavernicola]|uniref:ABM domain-containing protein n=1 Tax=Aspergillus cavernicola TaxID=176166 RepID=A0ABR4HBN3_9EURO